MHCLIVDDEMHSREYIRDLLNEFIPTIQIQEASHAEEAMVIMQQQNFDLVFLDIQMPGDNGFSLLEKLGRRDFEVVFITAYNEFAIAAIRENAVDYLLKPVKRSEFKNMLLRVMNVLEKKQLQARNPADYLEQQLYINHQQGIKMIKLRDILYLKADNSYTTIYSVNNQKFITSKSISTFENNLSSKHFFRIHKSYMINLAEIKEYQSQQSTRVLMNDDNWLQVSRYRQAAFIDAIKQHPVVIKI